MDVFATDGSHQYIAPGQLARWLQLSEKTVRRRIAAGLIPARKMPNGRWLIDVDPALRVDYSLPVGRKTLQNAAPLEKK